MASQKLTFTSIARILDKRDRRKLFALSIARILANSLDIVGLAGVALLAASFGQLASGSASQSPLQLPLLGQVLITEVEAVAIAIAVAITFLTKSVFSILLTLKTSLAVAHIEADFAEQLTRNYFSNDPTFAESLGESVSRFQNSIIVSTQAFTGFLVGRLTAVTEATLLLALLVIFVVVSPIATIATLSYLGCVVLVMNRLVNFRLRRNSQRVIEGSESVLTSSRDLFGVRREVVASGSRHYWLDAISSAKRKVATSTGLSYTLTSLPRYVIESALIFGIFGFLAAVVIFSDLASQATTLGVFLAGGLRLVASILPLQGAIQQVIGTSAQAQLAFNNLVAIKGQPDSLPGEGIIDICGPANLSFRRASYKYPGNELPTLDSVTFEVKGNTKTAIVGPSGAGKTTTFELATGFKLPTSGSVQINDIDSRQLLERSPGVIGIVPQRPHLVTGTLAENVSLVDKASTDMAQVKVSLEMAGLGEFADPNRLGLDGKITPDSGELSGGEIQRLGLARALYRNPKILFLDEATSALDAETESRVNKTLDELRGQMTIVLIAHRLSTVMNADSIIYLNKGKVVAQGTFAELKKSVPDFAKAVELMDLGE